MDYSNKIQKLEENIIKAENTITNEQNKIKNWKNEIKKYQDLEIKGLIEAIDLPYDELKEFLKKYKKKEAY